MANVSMRSQVEALTAAVNALLTAQAAALPLPAPINAGATSVTAKARKTRKAKVYASPVPTEYLHSIEHNGVQMRFAGPIAPEVTAVLFAAGFRFNGATKLWYSKIRKNETYPSALVRAQALAATLAA